MEIKITSRETIKPFLPTSDEHKFFQLCLFDQLQLITYLPTLLFYPKKEGLQEPYHVCAQLKKSLSETLTIFYPLAGRRKSHTFITCNDEGVLFLEAKVNLNMVEFLTPPKLEFLNKLLPCEPNKVHLNGEALPQVLVQVNIFSCGGIAIGTCNLHTLLDGCSGSLFYSTWAAICSGSRQERPHPDFYSASSFFPPLNHLSLHDHVAHEDSQTQKKCTTRRFVFNAESINTLRAEAKDDDGESSKSPTRYEALAAFIWKHMTLACKTESRDSTRPSVAIHIVDMRRRMGEPFSKYTIGNILWPVMAFCETVNANTGIGYLVSIAREKFGKLSRELYLRVKSDPNILGSNQCVNLPQGIETRSPIPVVLTSWCGLNFNELDFGWGKPLWVGVRGGDQETLPNVAVIIETDAGMEAWLTMEMQHIVILEKDMEFLRLALPNPSVSNI
ncbi:stemmadenine O-acetyltransferase-like [Gastrolobium bilobum]|uniref:stemmadenine O-acetyltransferase-like n=1 Tax=Gastrolobium bilobum TaxID=150636 RepID=UPI002AAF13E8|nr:stemmadenine O-acetyltransferase-like [Gastrolobium bilobum]